MPDTNTNPMVGVDTPKTSADMHLIPANQFTVAALTDIYNRARVDYVVPMPMSEAKLREYIANYDIALEHSTVAVTPDRQPLGLAMLGVRGDTTWVTRLGVIPDGRQRGVGRKIMDKLIENSRNIDASTVMLEVIKNNEPAQNLFEALGFKIIRELLVVRRPPVAINSAVGTSLYVQKQGYNEATNLLKSRTEVASWVTANESLYNAGNLSALVANVPSLGRGWLVYQNTVLQLGRLVLSTDAANKPSLAKALLQSLHLHHPEQDTIVENIPTNDEHWPAMQEMGYIISFRRIEMKLGLK